MYSLDVRIPLIPVFLALLVHPSLGAAQEADEQAAGPMEEITVIGEKTLIQLEQEYFEAEDSFFEMFNDRVDDWRYEVVCTSEAPTGTRIKQRICRSRHQMELRSEADKAPLLRGHIDSGAWAAMNMYDKGMRDKIVEIAEKDPKFLQALIEYRDKFQLYKSEEEKLCRKMVLVCLDSEED